MREAEELKRLARELKRTQRYFWAWNLRSLQAFIRDGGVCAYCGNALLETYGVISATDHLLPKTKYPERRNDISNLVPSCGECNATKREFDPCGGKPPELLNTEARLVLIANAKREIERRKQSGNWEQEFEIAKRCFKNAVLEYRQGTGAHGDSASLVRAVKRAAATVLLLGLIAIPAIAQMVRGDAIGNDPSKERLCVARSTYGAKSTAFEIDAGYLAQARKEHPDATFIAYGRGSGATIVECELNKVTGRFEGVAWGGASWYWRSLEPVPIDLNTRQAITLATKTCGDVATAQAARLQANFHHNVYLKFDRVHKASQHRPGSVHPKWVEAGDLIAGVKAEEDDVSVDGKAFYGPADPDYREAPFECLLSPDLATLKAIKFGPVTTNTTQ